MPNDRLSMEDMFEQQLGNDAEILRRIQNGNLPTTEAFLRNYLSCIEALHQAVYPQAEPLQSQTFSEWQTKAAEAIEDSQRRGR